MEGPHSNLLFDENYAMHELSGILPRAADYIFKEIKRLKTSFNRQYHIEVSSIEIYCENARDLFSDSD
jgi:hypothetical protein